MRKRGKILLFLLVVLCVAVYAGYRFWQQRIVDHKPPQITIEQKELSLSVADPQERLLEGISASDEHDGDVTGSLVVESVRGVVADQRFTVTYAAFDAAGNVAKARRTVYYEDYIAPRFSLDAPLIFRDGVTPNVFSVVHAQDVIDGDLTRQVKGTLVAGEQRMPEQGEYTVEFRVTNSLGDTAYLTVPVELVESWSGTPRVKLKEYLVYLKKGASFHPRDYLSEMNVGSMSISLDGTSGVDVSIKSDVNTQKAGTYRVDYMVTYDKQTARTRLLVVVED